ncbi:hypothetical protein KIP69_04935 [Geobacter sulfurreducens]|uniref:hypothetical protein n=1 Tax=Geobacter sulfurreducens TaxID=35554 RepID=UPI001BDC6F09|nr:hypothetical protein [Geobacter sulfurreducens]QVW36202.1 hypothetical protein KIP69_04935 [Geobacter sulfurreducens]
MSLKATDKEAIESARAVIEFLKGQLVTQLEPYSQRPGKKLVRLSRVWKESKLYRIVDLASAALTMFEDSRLVPGCTLTRSLYETVAQMYYIQKKMKEAIENKKLEEIHDYVVRGAWGSKDKSTEQEALQVLTAIDHLDKEFGGKDEYFHLCEYAHPNFKGGIGIYSEIKIPAYDVIFGMNPQGLPITAFGLGALDIILMVAKVLYERHLELEKDFSEFVFANATGVYAD